MLDKYFCWLLQARGSSWVISTKEPAASDPLISIFNEVGILEKSQHNKEFLWGE